ncbi:MAG: PH domain-containing protein [Rhodococcus sp. (in: high G+C Gram-positive bacteria)]
MLADDRAAMGRTGLTIRASRNTLRAARLASAVGMVIGVVFGVVLVITPGPTWLAFVGWVVVAWTVCHSCVEILFVLPAGVRNFSLRVTDTEVVVRQGALVRRIDRIPMSKITAVRTRTGPILRRFGLASCTILTASAEFSTLPIDDEDGRLLSAERSVP